MDDITPTSLHDASKALVCQFGFPFLFEVAVGAVMNFDLRIVDGEWGDHAVKGLGHLLGMYIGLVAEDYLRGAPRVRPMKADR